MILWFTNFKRFWTLSNRPLGMLRNATTLPPCACESCVALSRPSFSNSLLLAATLTCASHQRCAMLLFLKHAGARFVPFQDVIVLICFDLF